MTNLVGNDKAIGYMYITVITKYSITTRYINKFYM